MRQTCAVSGTRTEQCHRDSRTSCCSVRSSRIDCGGVCHTRAACPLSLLPTPRRASTMACSWTWGPRCAPPWSRPFEGEGEAKGGAEGEAKGQAKGEAEGEASDTHGGGGQLRLEGLEPSAAELLRGMLAWQPSERMSMAEVSTWTHPWRWIGLGVGL